MPPATRPLRQRAVPATVYPQLGAKTNVATTYRGGAFPIERRGKAYGEPSQLELSQRVEDMARMIDVLQRNIARATLEARAHPLGGGNHLRSLSIPAGQTVQVQHRLNRPFVGWHHTLVSGVARSAITEGTLAAGLTSTTHVPITNSGGATATVDVYVF